MKREIIEKRPNYDARMKERVFDYLETYFELPYWQDEAYYSFSLAQIEEVEDATTELHQMCVQAAGHVIEQGRLAEFGIPEHLHSYVATTFEREDPSIYGRFDFSYDGVNPPKMLEYNADTPTSLFEAAVLQWDWLEDRIQQNPVRFKDADQFNSIHEALVDTWKRAGQDYTLPPVIHFSCMGDNLEDFLTTEYMRDTAAQAGLKTHFVDIAHIGRTATDFCDDKAEIIKGMFKLYPWEFMFKELYAQNVAEDRTGFIEPAWKSILSNKAILPVLWEMFPDHPNLLPAFRDASAFNGQSYVKKAILGREGASITIVDGGQIIEAKGPYDDSGFVYQAYKPLPNFDGNFPVIGSWVVGGEARGMSIREDGGLITQNGSRFVPHMFVG